MRPIKPAKHLAGISRARMYLRRDLGWLDGFPCGGDWLELPPGAPASKRALDGNLTRRSTRTLNRLLRDFPQGLPRLVGDTTRWAESVRALLELLKSTIHGGAALPDTPLAAHPFTGTSLRSRARELRQQHETLEPVVAALEWYGWVDPKRIGASLRWVADEAEALETIVRRLGDAAPAITIRLWQLTSRHSARRTRAVVQLLGSEPLWQRPLECSADYVQRSSAAITKRESPPPAPPKVTLPMKVVHWILWLSEQDQSVQRRGLDLFSSLIDPQIAPSWQRWWSQFERAFERAQQLPVAKRKRDALAIVRRKAGARLRRMGDQRPPTVSAVIVDSLLRRLATKDAEALTRIIVKNLNRWPVFGDGAALRIAFAEHWMALWLRCGEAQRPMLARLITALTDYFHEREFSADAMAPWKSVWTRAQQGLGSIYMADDDILEDLKSRTQLTTYFEVLTAQRDRLTNEHAKLLCTLVANVPRDRVECAFAELKDTDLVGRYLESDSVLFAATLTEQMPNAFAGVLCAIDSVDHQYEYLHKRLAPVVRPFERAGLKSVLARAITDGALNGLMECAFKLAVLRDYKLAQPSIWVSAEATPDWIGDHPEALHDSLELLARFDPCASKTVRRILRKDFPSRDEIVREIDRLQQFEALSAAQHSRITTLEERLKTRITISAQRLENLRKKLEKAGVRRIIDTWCAQVDEQFRAALPGFLEVAELPDWMTRRDVMRALVPIQDLSLAAHKLARQVLIERSGPPPWDFREARANREFLHRLRERGIDAEPWIDGDGAIEVKAEDDTRLTLNLERDPLEMMQMGAHFNTCLAPGAFNYFSVFSNIVDINKQVLYARDPHGRVFGRMLLALTDGGGLLPFYPYARNLKAGFSDMAKAFAHDLAAKMKTVVVFSGNVRTLVASRWYDDGPIDLTEQLPGLREESSFRHALPAMQVESFVAKARLAVAPLPLNELTLSMVLALPELEARPDLVTPLMPIVRRIELPLHGLMRMAQLLTLAGDVDLGSLVEQIYRTAIGARGAHYLSYDVATLLIQFAPVRALQLIRHTREPSVRRWRDEWDGMRLMLAAQANARLRRNNKARELYALAIEKSRDKTSRAACRQALDALGG